MSTDPSLEPFALEVAKGEALALDRAALLLERFEHPGLEVEHWLGQLDELASHSERSGRTGAEVIAGLFGGSGLRGNTSEYYDPRNSFLSQVLERRLGIPISLALVAIEVGRRLGIAVEGVPFPGHFLVRVREGGESVVLDAFDGGRTVEDGELLLRQRAVTGRIAALGPAELGPASRRQLLARMLQNLKGIYFRGDDIGRALAIEERLLALAPDEPAERRDRGLLLARLGRELEAAAELEGYLARTPDADDADAVRKVLEGLASQRGPVQ